MAKSASISARIDPDLKAQAEQIFSELELTASQAIALFYKQVILKQGIPFEVSLHQNENKNASEHRHTSTNGQTNSLDQSIVEPRPESSIAKGREHAAILKEREAYEAMHPELCKRYPDQYVAIYQGEVVDHDEDEIALLKRRRKNFRGKSVLVTQVEETPERKTLYIRSRKLIR